MIQFVEQIQRRASIQGNPLCALCEAKRPGYLQMPGAFCVTAFRIRGCIPCAAFRLSSYGKRRDPGSHAFCVFYCLMHNAIGAGVCRFWSGLPGNRIPESAPPPDPCFRPVPGWGGSMARSCSALMWGFRRINMIEGNFHRRSFLSSYHRFSTLAGGETEFLAGKYCIFTREMLY